MCYALIKQGTFAAGQFISGSGVINGTTITSQLGGTAGGAGTYRVSQTQTVSTAEQINSGTGGAGTYSCVRQTVLNRQRYIMVNAPRRLN